MLSLPLSRAATAGTGAQLCRGRGAGNSSRTGRSDPGDRSDQAGSRKRQPIDRATSAGGCAEYAIPRTQTAQETLEAGMLIIYDRENVDRLSTFLRDRA